MAEIVRVGHVLVRATLAGVAIVLTGVVLLIFDVVVGREAGLIAGGAMLAVTLMLWLLLPRLVKPTSR
jgi:membrane-bound ClpP family serine protease